MRIPSCWATRIGICLLAAMGVALIVQAASDGEMPMSSAASTVSGPQSAILDAGGVNSTAAVTNPSDVDEWAQKTIDLLYATDAVKAGVPEVLLSREVQPSDMPDLGFGVWEHEVGCDIPLQIVILGGDFDLRTIAMQQDEVLITYVVYIYDVRTGLELAWYGDPDGSLVEQALGDPSISAVDEEWSVGYSPAIPCDPTAVDTPGFTEEEVSAMETQEAAP